MKATRTLPGLLIVVPLLLLLGVSCSRIQRVDTLSPEYRCLAQRIDIPLPTEEQRKTFHRKVKAEKASVTKENGDTVSGYVSDNRAFLETIITPLILPYVEELSARHPVEITNTLSLFSFEIYRLYFGKDSRTWVFYRWGGDLLDLDDPQQEGHRYKYRYGLDCSGFVAMPYELAVHFDLMKPEDEAAVFSSPGFEHYCEEHNLEDKGGRGGTSNRYRLDTTDMLELGRIIMSVELEGEPHPGDLSLLQAGDIVVGPGHTGIIVDVSGELCYLEVGDTVHPPKGMTMTPVADALRQFARDYPLTVRRSLPDKK